LSEDLFLQYQILCWRTSTKAILDCNIIHHHPAETLWRYLLGTTQSTDRARGMAGNKCRHPADWYSSSWEELGQDITTMGKKHTSKTW